MARLCCICADNEAKERCDLGIVYLITFWYPVEERSVRSAFVLASATAAGAFGGCIAYGVGNMNGAGGLEGFRWPVSHVEVDQRYLLTESQAFPHRRYHHGSVHPPGPLLPSRLPSSRQVSEPRR